MTIRLPRIIARNVDQSTVCWTLMIKLQKVLYNWMKSAVFQPKIKSSAEEKMLKRTLQGSGDRHCSLDLIESLTGRQRVRRPAGLGVESAQSHRSSYNHCYPHYTAAHAHMITDAVLDADVCHTKIKDRPHIQEQWCHHRHGQHHYCRATFTQSWHLLHHFLDYIRSKERKIIVEMSYSQIITSYCISLNST